MDASTLYQQTLWSALGIAGDEARLARRLQVPLTDLKGWLRGVEAPPLWAFLRAVDLVTDPEAPVSVYVTQTPVEPARRSSSSIHSRSSAESQVTLRAQAPLRSDSP
jgi:hypothetical protein